MCSSWLLCLLTGAYRVKERPICGLCLLQCRQCCLQVIEEIQRMRHSQQEHTSDPSNGPGTPSYTATQPDGAASRKRVRDSASADSTTAAAVRPGAEVAQADRYATVYDNGDSFTKLRPGAFEMLAALQQCCELRIFTMGDSRYACAMASLLDASGALFRNRIVARDDANPRGLKGLEKAGAMPPLTAIIDDTVGALSGLSCAASAWDLAPQTAMARC